MSTLENLKKAIIQNQIEWQRHCLQRMIERGISRLDVINVILHGDTIEDYPANRPLPCKLLCATINNRPIHVVVAFNVDLNKAFVITAYEPDTNHFESDLKTRRKQ